MPLLRATGPVHEESRWQIGNTDPNRQLYVDTLDETAAGDGDDATYFRWVYTQNLSAGGAGATTMVYALFPATVMNEADVTNVVFRGRVSRTTTRSAANDAGGKVGLILSANDTPYSFDLYSAETPVPGDGTVVEIEVTLTETDMATDNPGQSWTEFVGALGAGVLRAGAYFIWANTEAQTGATDTVLTHDLWFEAGIPAVPPPPPLTGPLRPHYSRSLREAIGDLTPGVIIVRICEVGTTALVPVPVYKSRASTESSGAAWTIENALVDFYLDQPRAVDIRLSLPNGTEHVLADQWVGDAHNVSPETGGTVVGNIATVKMMTPEEFDATTQASRTSDTLFLVSGTALPEVP